MSRGRRADLPSQGGGWIDYTPPEPGWKYWEDRFGQVFPEGWRRQIMRELHFFRLAKEEYSREGRRDLKQTKRDLRKALKTGSFPDDQLQRFVTVHTLDFAFENPEAGISEKIGYVLKQIEEDPGGLLISGPKPEILFTHTLFNLLRSAGPNVSRGSAGQLSAMADKRSAPVTPFVEFVGRTIWRIPADKPISVAEAEKIQKIIGRRSEYITRSE